MAGKERIGFIGTGKMATALALGLVRAGVFEAGRIAGSDKHPDARKAFATAVGATEVAENASLVAQSDIVVLAVKPQNLDEMLKEVGGTFTADQLVISIAAGVTTARIEALLPAGCRVVRAMPNTPMLVGEGAAAVCRGAHATEDDLATARRLFEAAAKVIAVDENLIDAVTAVSGSGPAYFFYFLEALVAGGVAEGLAREQATELAVQTMRGAAKLLELSDRSAEELRADVTSPGGTTQAAIESMEAAGVGRGITAAVAAAAARSRELGAGS